MGQFLSPPALSPFRRFAILRMSIAFAVLAFAAAVLPAMASAVPGVVSVQSDTASVSGNGGGSATLTVSAPVAGPGAVSQELVQSWDPSRLQLTGATGIVAPAGWSLSYSPNGSTFGAAPGSPSGWAAIRAVKATGSITSGGNSAGFQVVEGTGTGSVPVSGAFSSAGGGDGWDVSFDDEGHVFNVYHHDGAWYGTPAFSTPAVDCHTRTGASCGPGWPFALRVPNGTTGPGGLSGQPWYHTNNQSMSWVDTANARIWVPTNLNDGSAASGTGFVCVDVADLTTGPAWCGGSIVNAFVKLGPSVCGRDCALGLAVGNGRLFAWDASTGDLICLDPSATRAGNLPGAACEGQPFSFAGVATASLVDGYALGTTQNGLIFGSAAGKAICFDPATLAACTAWSTGPVTLAGTFPTMIFEVPAADGTPGAVCFTRYDEDRGCFSGDGSSPTALSGSHAGSALMAYIVNKVSARDPKTAAVTGSRVYWSDGNWPGGGFIYCWDTALASGAGAACANWPVGVSAYTATIDSQNANCIWTNTDSGAITTIDAITGGSTCVTPPAAATFSAPVLIPRLACSGATGIRSWQTFQLTGPSAATYSGATLTVLTAGGSVISGWNRLPITGGSRTIDLSSLSVSTSGQAPQFRISLANKTTNDPIQGTITAIGDAPQLCAPLVPQLVCPATASQHPSGPPTPAPSTITGSGLVQYASNPTEAFTTGTASVAVTAPSAASCLGTITGTATMVSGGAPVPGATVRLLDGSGGGVATTTTDSSGAYTFDNLAAVTGYRVAFGAASQVSVSAATEIAAATSRSVTANATTTVNGTYELLWTDPLSGSAAHGTAVTMTPAPVTTAGVQDSAAFDHAQTCIVDPADTTCKARVTIPGEGAWAADPTTGAITFTPAEGYSGTTTSVTYRVTETSTGRSVSSTAVAEIGPAPPVTTTRTAIPATPATSASIRLTLRPSTRTIRVGQPIVVQVRVANTGGTTAQRVRACAVIPAGFVVNATGGGTITGGRVCYAVGAVTSTSPRTYSLTLTPSAEASQTTRFTGTATAMNAKKVRAAGKARPVRVVHALAEAEPVTG